MLETHPLPGTCASASLCSELCLYASLSQLHAARKYTSRHVLLHATTTTAHTRTRARMHGFLHERAAVLCELPSTPASAHAHLPACPCCYMPFFKPALLVGKDMRVLATPCCTEAAAGRKHYESQSLSLSLSLRTSARVALAFLSGTPEREARR